MALPRRTAAHDVDRDFELDIDICKAAERKGQRVFTGVASGVLEDADGERVSANAILKMARQAVAGMKLVAGSHAQDWHNEMGDVVKLEHDAENDELMIETVLPPEGQDPFADKAWRQQTIEGKPLGFSIGGKCQKAYFELTDTGKKRKVLDDVLLRHVALTQKPSYRQSFAQAVAKAGGVDELDVAKVADDDYTMDAEAEPTSIVVERVEKTDDDGGDVAKADSTIASTQQDTAGNKGVKGDDTKAPDVSGDDAEKDLPEGGGARHLACPNCGHEFAAGMPAEQDAPAAVAGDATTDREARKTAPESEDTMPLDTTLENLRKLAGTTDETQVEKKTDDEEPAPAAAKADDGPTDVEKLVAASHEANQTSHAALVEKVGEAFGEVGKAIKGIHALIAELPGGRQSIARVKAQGDGGGTPPTLGTVAKTDDDDETPVSADDVAKRVDDLFAKRDPEQDPDGTQTGIAALKVANEAHYGIKA